MRNLQKPYDRRRMFEIVGTVSLAFPKGKRGRVPTQVVDPRGNEVVRVHKVGGCN